MGKKQRGKMGKKDNKRKIRLGERRKWEKRNDEDKKGEGWDRKKRWERGKRVNKNEGKE